MSLFPFVQGIGLGVGLIMPIGAQNSYVLNQAIKRNYHLVVASICVFCDMVLMSAGVYGGSALIGSNALLHTLITWAGIIFLTAYGWFSFTQALKPQSAKETAKEAGKSLKVVILTTLAVTLLNPHVYLDTVVILGSVGNRFEGLEKTAFTAGIISASFVWLYSLAFAGARLSNLLSHPPVRRSIDLMVSILMWAIAWSLFADWTKLA